MAHDTIERVNSVDAALLAMESPTQRMHVGGLFVFEGAEEFEFSRFVELVRSRLHLVPRYRQKPAYTPLNLAEPAWVDDTEFDLGYHVRHAALPTPGTMSQLTDYAARILSRSLDRDRPLWELYVIDGLKDGRFAILGKTHQAVFSGGLDLAGVLLDESPAVGEIPEPEPWTPRPPPSGYDLVWSGARDLITSPTSAVDAVRRVIHAPLKKNVRRALEVGRGVLSVAQSNLRRPVPRSILNSPPGLHRRLAVQRISLEDVKRIKDAYGTSVNDVVLAVVADATGHFLRTQDVDTTGLTLRALVPVSQRLEEPEDGQEQRVVSAFIDLPMDEMDPVERLQVCQERMEKLEASHQAVGASFLVGLSGFAPPTLHAMAARVAARSRLFNFMITNVPGPQEPRYCLGARLRSAFPFTPLTATQSYAIGIISLEGWLNVGLTADWELRGIRDVTRHLIDSVAELLRCVDAKGIRHELAGRPPDELTTSELEIVLRSDVHQDESVAEGT